MFLPLTISEDMRVIVCIVLLTVTMDVSGQIMTESGTLVMFWNVENFFDWTDQGTGESDTEFSSMGSRRWTRKKFYAKCDAIAKTVFWIGEKYGRLPDVIGLAEVENGRVLHLLLESSLLRKCGYDIVHHDSGDRRGIDAALLYRKEVFDLSESFITTPEHEGEKLATRDILTVRMRRKTDGEQITFIVNHHPSKYGGSKASESRRNSVMISLSELCDSLLKTPENSRIVAMGDFNDNLEGPQFSVMDRLMVNKALELHQKGEGTIRYEGRWDLIDMFMVSPALDRSSVMEIVRVPFLMTREKKHPGEKPFRTYSGPRYIGGVSDHCPVVLLIDE